MHTQTQLHKGHVLGLDLHSRGSENCLLSEFEGVSHDPLGYFSLAKRCTVVLRNTRANVDISFPRTGTGKKGPYLNAVILHIICVFTKASCAFGSLKCICSDRDSYSPGPSNAVPNGQILRKNLAAGGASRKQIVAPLSNPYLTTSSTPRSTHSSSASGGSDGSSRGSGAGVKRNHTLLKDMKDDQGNAFLSPHVEERKAPSTTYQQVRFFFLFFRLLCCVIIMNHSFLMFLICTATVQAKGCPINKRLLFDEKVPSAAYQQGTLVRL